METSSADSNVSIRS